MNLVLAILLVLTVHSPLSTAQPSVELTLVSKDLASSLGAYCLDGSLPGYYLIKGFGTGANNWLLYLEGGGWCNTVESCLERAKLSLGSTNIQPDPRAFGFDGILSSNPTVNPDFYNWNIVRFRYCDGASFAGDSMYQDGTSLLYFRGQKIWEAIIRDLLPQGLANAEKALLSGCSAGGLAVYLHCDNFAGYLPKTATVKCLGDAGFFLDAEDISKQRTMRSFFQSVVSFQGVEKNLDKTCTSSSTDPSLCFFPQYALGYIQTPIFVLNSAYDYFQFEFSFVPASADIPGYWAQCKLHREACSQQQIDILQGYRDEMITALKPLSDSSQGGMFINSCFAHCQSDSTTWNDMYPPRINNRKIAETVGDWYFSRNTAKEIDCPYPCDNTCYNLI